MKRFILSFVILCSTICTLQAAPLARIAGKNVSNFSIVYDRLAEDEEGLSMALDVQKMVFDSYGVLLPINHLSSSFSASSSSSLYSRSHDAILLQHTDSLTTFQYSVHVLGHCLVIEAGGCWAMRYAAEQAVRQMGGHGILRNYTLRGSVEGEVLFPKKIGTDLRILDDNIWEYNAEDIPEAWKKAGIDCRDDHRAPQFAQLVRAYMPDVVLLQEYSHHMHDRFYPLIRRYGYQIAWEPKGNWNCTPVFYRTDQLQMLESNFVLFAPERWSNHGTKSYTSAVFRHRATGDTLACISTHLWWQSDKKAPGSTLARAAQVRLVMAEAEAIRDRYDCTIFVAGDMNSEEHLLPIRQFLEGGYVPCYQDAEFRTDNQNGHHVCSPTEVGTRQSRRQSAERQKGAIDHCFIYHAQHGAKVQNFECLTPWFTVLLTDHYPLLVDTRLR